MKTDTLRKLAEANDDLIELINQGLEQAARPDAATICRLGDGAIAQLLNTKQPVQQFLHWLDRFPNVIVPVEKGIVTIYVDIDTDDDAQITFEGKNYCFYGDDLRIQRTFRTVQECYDFVKTAIVIKPGFKVSKALTEWIDDFIETHKRGEDWFGIHGNQTVEIEIIENV